jgi:hypothetical protein
MHDWRHAVPSASDQAARGDAAYRIRRDSKICKYFANDYRITHDPF